jgi:hypothetical protein
MDDGQKPDPASFTGGTIESGTYKLTGVVHHGSHYGGATEETLVVDATAHTLLILDGSGADASAAFATIGYDISTVGGNTLEGQMNCCTSPYVPQYCLVTVRGYYYTFAGTGTGATITWSSVGSEDVQTYTKQ